MAIIRVKRGNTVPTTSKLSYLGELAFDYGSNALYARGPSSVVKIGGEMEVVYFYEGYGYTHTLQYAFDPTTSIKCISFHQLKAHLQIFQIPIFITEQVHYPIYRDLILPIMSILKTVRIQQDHLKTRPFIILKIVMQVVQ